MTFLTELQNNYPDLNIQKVQQLKRNDKYLQNIFTAISQEKKYFLKYLNDDWKKDSLDIMVSLIEYGYPIPNIHDTASSESTFSFNDKEYFVQDYVELSNFQKLNLQKAESLGNSLGKLHVLSKKVDVNRKSIESLEEMEQQLNEKIQKNKMFLSLEVLAHADKVRAIIKKLYSHKKDTICHGEFTNEHVYFVNNEVFTIIDWDGVGLDNKYFDLGTASYSFFENNEFVLENFEEFYRAYNEILKQDQDSQFIFNSMLFGISKFFIWGLSDFYTHQNIMPEKQMRSFNSLISKEKEVKSFLDSLC